MQEFNLTRGTPLIKKRSANKADRPYISIAKLKQNFTKIQPKSIDSNLNQSKINR
jgi:hypothetical protein